MKQWKMPLAALLLFGAMLAWVLAGGPSPGAEEPAPDEEVEDEQIKIIELDDKDDISEVTVHWDGRDDIRIGASGEGEEREYQILSPYERPTDQDRARLLFTSAAELRVKRAVTEQPEDLAEFGLDDPVGEMVVSMVDGSTHRVIIGGASPLGAGRDHPDRYVQIDDDDTVYLMGGSQIEFMTAEADRWSDLTMLELDTVQQIDVRGDGRSWSISRTDDPFEWKLSEPLDAPARGSTVRNFISEFHRLQAVEYALDDPAEDDLADFGLDEPAMRIGFHDKEAEYKEIELGSFADEEQMTVYAAVSGRPFIYITEAGIMTVTGMEEAEDWLDRPFGPLRYREVTDVQWKWEGEHLSLTREENDWILRSSAGDELSRPDADETEAIVREVLALDVDKVSMPDELPDDLDLEATDNYVQVQTQEGTVHLDLLDDADGLYGMVRGYEAVHALSPEAREVMQQLNALR